MTNWTSMSAAQRGPGEWYLASSLVKLGNEVNARWPNRDTGSDGAIGDASHQARKSDHNPDWDAGGVVRAIDIDNNGINVQQLLDATIGDQRVWYVIWDRHIYSRTYNWTKRPYDGPDPHTGHVHISINHDRASENDTSNWFVVKSPSPPKEENPLSGVTDADAAKIGTAVAAAVSPVIDRIEKAYTLADNDYDSQRAAWVTVAQALAARRIEEAAAKGPITPDVLKAVHAEVWNFLKPLWSKP